MSEFNLSPQALKLLFYDFSNDENWLAEFQHLSWGIRSFLHIRYTANKATDLSCGKQLRIGTHFKSFSAQGCDPGYESINGFCENIDECTTNQHNCKTGSRKTNSFCHDTEGSFYCSCLPGRELDGNGNCRTGNYGQLASDVSVDYLVRLGTVFLIKQTSSDPWIPLKRHR